MLGDIYIITCIALQTHKVKRSRRKTKSMMDCQTVHAVLLRCIFSVRRIKPKRKSVQLKIRFIKEIMKVMSKSMRKQFTEMTFDKPVIDARTITAKEKPKFEILGIFS